MANSLHVIMLIVICVFKTTLALSHVDECLKLLQFKNTMSLNVTASSNSHAYRKVASWSKSMNDCCLWDGVECSSGHVTGLDLSSSYLYGPIFSNNSLFDVIHLRKLNLADNDFSFSHIPSEIGRLSQLENLNLSGSCFSGHVPKEISYLTHLVSLDLTVNDQLKLQSPGFRNLVRNSSKTLKELFLSGVEIQGELPASIGNLIHLNQLKLRFCFFEGPLPVSVSNLTQLTVLDLGNNNFDTSNCDWLGKFPNLSYLDLSGNNLSCEIPSSIGNLTQLREIHLSNASMVGQIPSSIMNLTHLTTLDLWSNKFTGHIPSLENLLNLTYLSISDNSFDRWKLPDWLGKLDNINSLDLTAVNLYGETPSSFFNLTKLEDLFLERNKLNGPISSLFSNLQNLTYINLSDNNFTGMIELDIFLSLKKLKNLELGGNRITLSATNNHSNTFPPKFEILELQSCNLRAFPHFLRFQHQLHRLYLDNNKIEGLIPAWMWNISKETLNELSLTENLLTGFEQQSPVAPWAKLSILDLSHNMLRGLIPMPPPATLNFFVSNNKLTGEIPPSICDLQSLKLLDLSFNDITGSIPSCIGNLSNSLLALNLRGNSLQGSIPNTFTNECKLGLISLSDNKLKGQVPRSLNKCVSLQMLDLGNNSMKDTFPFMLGALSELEVLSLKLNKFHGVISFSGKTNYNNFPKLRIIDLSYNLFSGDLPQQYFQDWSAMKVSQATAEYMHNEINFVDQYDKMTVSGSVGDYSYSMNLIRKGVKTEYEKIPKIFIAVDLSSNKFGGIIPESIKDLKALQLLNLSNNEFSGIISPSIGGLTQLEALDLSSNKLSGKIPQELVQLNFLSDLNVSYNNLTGPIPRGKQFGTFLNDSYMGNPALCGDPLSTRCDKTDVPDPPQVSPDQNIESDHFPSGVDWFVILSGLGSGLVIGLVFGNQLTTRCYIWFLIRFRRCRRLQE